MAFSSNHQSTRHQHFKPYRELLLFGARQNFEEVNRSARQLKERFPLHQAPSLTTVVARMLMKWPGNKAANCASDTQEEEDMVLRSHESLSTLDCVVQTILAFRLQGALYLP